MDSEYKHLFDRRHDDLESAAPIHRLISDSYRGGSVYKAGGHLFQHPKEPSVDFEKRNKRAIYFNSLQPVTDILVGILMESEPKRQIPSSLSFLEQTADRRNSLSSFMLRAWTKSFLYPCGILVDSPNFDPEEIRTRADQNANNLQPYCVLYEPFHIRDFALDDSMELEWVLLDDSYFDESDPMKPRQKVEKRRLWTKEYFQDFIKFKTSEQEFEIVASEPMQHGLGQVPFVFLNWKDSNDEYITESPAEDIALISRQVFNVVSQLDEMLATGTFKMLLYPSEDGTVPEELKDEGIGNMTVMPINPDKPNKPEFLGAKLEEVSPFLAAVEFYEKKILQKVGLDKDSEKSGVQSGEAKRLEYRKTYALLQSAAQKGEKVEAQIFKLAGLWLSQNDVSVNIEYNKNFDPQETDERITRYLEIYREVSYPAVRKLLANRIISAEFDPDDQEIKEAIEALKSEKAPDERTLEGILYPNSNPGQTGNQLDNQQQTTATAERDMTNE